jgi:hypothetical protein
MESKICDSECETKINLSNSDFTAMIVHPLVELLGS